MDCFARSAVVATLVGLTTGLPAQWVEVGDAGDVRATAQVPDVPGPLASISGNLTFANGADVDVYLVVIRDVATFTATTLGSAPFDTQLFLFDEHGRGVQHNDDWGGTVQSSLTGALVPTPGRYYLAISGYNNDPIGKQYLIWLNQPTNTRRAPDGPSRFEEWDRFGNQGATGSYTISLTGVESALSRVTLPDSHHLTESPMQTGMAGSSLWWRSAGGRFQVLYEASHFLTAGVTGPIVVRKIAFRTEDGVPNPGGHQWAGVQVRLAATSLTAVTMSSTFATNLAPPAPNSTLPGPVATVPVSTVRALGGTPNNDLMVIDLHAAGADIVLDPTGPQPNLLVDVRLPNAATFPTGTGAPPAIQDSGPSASVVRGRGLTAGTYTAPGGLLSDAPPVLGVEFDGAGGNRLVIPARNEFYGAACGGSPSAFYEAFLHGQAFDLTGLRLVPDSVTAPTRYTVDKQVGAFDATKVNAAPNSIDDDAVVVHPLGFTFRFPGGATTSIGAATNGFVWLSGNSAVGQIAPSVASLLGSTLEGPRVCPCWYDFHCGRNTTWQPTSGLHVRTDASGGAGNRVCYVTWLDVGAYGVFLSGANGLAVHRLQCVLFEATGVIEFRYGSMPKFVARTGTGTPAIVGFTRGQTIGGPSRDPRSRDLSLELPFTTSVEGTTPHMGLTAVTTPDAGGAHYGGRAFGGQSVRWNVTGIPASAVIGALVLDVAAERPGLQLPGIVAPGCVISVPVGTCILAEVVASLGTSHTGQVPLVLPPGPPFFDGIDLYAQFVVLDGVTNGGDLVTVASNALRQVVGRD